ncbi:hypothetical protein P9112_005852 [Eukaryota sp. TZLM1-RC]
MVQSYLKLEHEDSFGVTVSSSYHGVVDSSGRIIYCPSSDYISAWNTKLNILQSTFTNEPATEVTCLQYFPHAPVPLLAVGYASGAIRVFNTNDSSLRCCFDGHRSAITVLKFNHDGSLLASGSNDTDIVVWNIFSEKGVCRLKGHSNSISGLSFLSHTSSPFIVSSSRDTTVRVWDVSLSQCVETIIGHRVELFGLDSVYMEDLECWLVAIGTAFKNFILYKLSFSCIGEKRRQSNQTVSYDLIGSVDRHADNGNGRTTFLEFCIVKEAIYLLISGKSRGLDVFKISNQTEREKRLKKRAKRRIKEGKSDEVTVEPEDWSRHHRSIRTSSMIVGFSIRNDFVYISTKENSVEIFGFLTDNDVCSTLSQGHSSYVTSSALTFDDLQLVTGSNDGLRTWSLSKKTLSSFIPFKGKITKLILVPGNRFVVFGTKEGDLGVADLSASSITFTDTCHPGGVTSLVMLADQSGVVSGGSDKTIKFWDFELSTSSATSSFLTLTPSRTLEVADGVSSLTVSNDNKFILAGLLDNSVKVFYSDSFNLFLSLYGHKLPVVSMDVSFDNQILITGSLDKTVKIWGLDFGDCHRSLLAHDGEVSGVKWLPQTHHFISIGKDKLVKYWDGDSFKLVQTLKSHTQSINTLSVASNGGFLVTAGLDRSIRIFRKTSSPIYPHLEQSDQMESEANIEAAQILDRARQDLDPSRPTVVTTASLKAGDRLVSALELCSQWIAEQVAYLNQLKSVGIDPRHIGPETKLPTLPPTPPIYLMNKTTSQYLYEILADLPTVDLSDAVSYIPFSLVECFASLLISLVNDFTVPIELIARTSLYLFNSHGDAIRNSPSVSILLDKLGNSLSNRVNSLVESSGICLEALMLIQREIEAESGPLFDPITGEKRINVEKE